jgi:hypothetical protein
MRGELHQKLLNKYFLGYISPLLSHFSEFEEYRIKIGFQ